jgi:DNA-binding transcriptional regulator YhcF (GntR family)
MFTEKEGRYDKMAPIVRQTPVSVRSKIYHTLYDAQEFCSKQMLASKCGISMPTLYQNLNELMEEGLVQYSGEEKSKKTLDGPDRKKSYSPVMPSLLKTSSTFDEKTSVTVMFAPKGLPVTRSNVLP